MEQFHCISGLPRSGSTLLCNILNMNSDFHATATSPTPDLLDSQAYCYSHNQGFKASNRLDSYEEFEESVGDSIRTLYKNYKVVFDKNRIWPSKLLQLDAALGNSDTKILWTYRDPFDVIRSMENQHRKRPLIQFLEEQNARGSMTTLSSRVNNWMNGIMHQPILALQDAIEMKYAKPLQTPQNLHSEDYEDRIMIIGYHELCNNTQEVMDRIHEFLGLPKYQYDKNKFKDLKQTTNEYDTFYNYKYPHTISEGKIEFKRPDIDVPYEQYVKNNPQMKWMMDYCLQQLAFYTKEKVLKNKGKKNLEKVIDTI